MGDISIHAPRAGGDRKRGFDVFAGYKFQSTLPVRGAMPYIIICQRKKAFQSTLPVRGATSQSERLIIVKHISIHAPRAGGDCSRPIQAYLHY